jgi:hypothetical protein
VFTPEKYGMELTTAAEEVARPLQEMIGVAPPEETMGQVPVTEETAPTEAAVRHVPPMA